MHEGHRGRLVGKIRDGSMVYEHELLEILLFNSCPRRDLNATAHSLIARFGDIAGVLSASEAELQTVAGVGKSMAQYIVCVGKSFERCNDCLSFAVIGNTSEFRKFLSARPVPDDDVLELCVMDKDGRLRRICTFRGSNGNPPEAPESEILKCVSVHRPYGLFVASTRAHGGNAPTPYDDVVCGRIHKITNLCGVKFYDYCIVGEDGEIFSYFIADRIVFGEAGDSYGE